MTIKQPASTDIPALRHLWQQAFGDTDAFLNAFFTTGFSPARCRCLTVDGALAAALYWFDCTLGGKKLAYLYAVATEEAFQRQGLCAALMEDTHRHLEQTGYCGAVLVPGSDALRRYYRRFGYADFGGMATQTVPFDALLAEATPLSKREYARLRRQYLPQGSVMQEGACLDFFATFAHFYAGNGFVLSVTEDTAEVLGNVPAFPAATPEERTLRLRFPGETPFAMYLPLTEETAFPTYFGIALD